jgi:hypothetical protein
LQLRLGSGEGRAAGVPRRHGILCLLRGNRADPRRRRDHTARKMSEHSYFTSERTIEHSPFREKDAAGNRPPMDTAHAGRFAEKSYNVGTFRLKRLNTGNNEGYDIAKAAEMASKTGKNREERQYALKRKIIRIGSSFGITIPQFILEQKGLKKGSTVKLRFNSIPGILVEKEEQRRQ